MLTICQQLKSQNALEHQAPNTKHRTPSAEHKAQNTKHRTPSTKQQFPHLREIPGRVPGGLGGVIHVRLMGASVHDDPAKAQPHCGRNHNYTGRGVAFLLSFETLAPPCRGRVGTPVKTMKVYMRFVVGITTTRGEGWHVASLSTMGPSCRKEWAFLQQAGRPTPSMPNHHDVRSLSRNSVTRSLVKLN